MSADTLKLLLDQSVIAYRGVFEEPAFSFWKKDKIELIEGLYKALAMYDVSLSDISVSRDSDDIDDESITVSIDNFGDYVFKISEVECATDEGGIDNFKSFLELLQHADDWLRHSAPALKYRVHIFELGGHGHLQGSTTSEHYFQHFFGGGKKLKSINQDALLANGMIFNWTDVMTGGRCHLEVDHSLDIPGGLYVRWLLVTQKDNWKQEKNQLAFQRVGMHSLDVLRKVLAELHLEIEENL